MSANASMTEGNPMPDPHSPLENVRPMGDNVIVSVDEPVEHTTVSGFVLPPAVGKTPDTATVVAVGNGRYVDGVRVPLELAVGDRIRFAPFAGDEINIGGQSFRVLRKQEILAKEAVNG